MQKLETNESLEKFWSQVAEHQRKERLAEIKSSSVVLRAPVPVGEFLWWLANAKNVEVRDGGGEGSTDVNAVHP